MKTVFTLISLISAVHYATAADCSALKTFSTELLPLCSIEDVYIKWPNYANQSTYYKCIGVGNPELISCPSGEYFNYVMQICCSCSDYIPPVPCDKLKTQNPPVCVAIGSNPQPDNNSTQSTQSTTGYPTPNYPDTTTTTVRTTVTTTPRTTTTRATTTTTAGAGVPTPEVVTSTTGAETTAATFPGPPSPVTSNPGVPTPPTPAPTPPTVENEPPVVPSS